jgi:hypothetical protein
MSLFSDTSYSFKINGKTIQRSPPLSNRVEFNLLECNAMQYGKSQLILQTNILPPSSGLKRKLSKK